MRSLSVLALLVSCAAPDALAPEVVDAPTPDAATPRGGLVHMLEAPLVPGVTSRFRVAGAVPGETVRVIRSFSGLGDGSCPPVIGGNCMGILDPLTVHGSAVADASGNAYIEIRVPISVSPGAELATQAVAVRGVGGADSALSEPMLDVVRADDGEADIASADLGSAPEGCDVATRVPLTNTGGGTLTIDAIVVDGPFVLSGPGAYPVTLDPDETLNMLVQADMTGAGALEGSLTVVSDDPDGDVMVDLSATISADAACPDTVGTEVTARYGAIDLTVMLDTTCSMGGVVDATTEAFGGIAADMAGFASDLSFGVATYDDYNDAGFGSGLDKPFILLTQQTNDSNRAQNALNGIALHSGADGPESTHEALYQAFTGTGYDQNCNGVADPDDDVLPFMSDPADPFGGTSPDSFVEGVAGTGDIGGVGYREGTLRYLVYATDNELRDPLAGYGSPGGCPGDATSEDSAGAALDLGAKLIGVYSGGGFGDTRAQMEALAIATGSEADVDGDGVPDPVVLDFDGDAATLRSNVVDALSALLPPEADFDGTLELVVVNDPDGIVDSVSPASVDGAVYDEVLPFDVTLNGVDVGGAGQGVSSATLALFHDGTRLGAVNVYGVPHLD